MDYYDLNYDTERYWSETDESIEVGDPESGGTPAKADEKAGHLTVAQSTIRPSIDPNAPKYTNNDLPDDKNLKFKESEMQEFGFWFTGGSGSCGASAKKSEYLGDIKDLLGLVNKFGNKGLSGSKYGDLVTFGQAVADFGPLVDKISYDDENIKVPFKVDTKKAEYGEGKYNTWIRAEMIVANKFEDISGDSSILIFQGDTSFFFGKEGRLRGRGKHPNFNK